MQYFGLKLAVSSRNVFVILEIIAAVNKKEFSSLSPTPTHLYKNQIQIECFVNKQFSSLLIVLIRGGKKKNSVGSVQYQVMICAHFVKVSNVSIESR